MSGKAASGFRMPPSPNGTRARPVRRRGNARLGEGMTRTASGADAVAAGGLRLVELRVGVADEVRRILLARGERRDADGDGHRDVLFVELEALALDELARLLGHRQGALRVHLRQEQRELLAAVAREHVLAADLRPDRRGDL